MKQKIYRKPATRIAQLEQQCPILSASGTSNPGGGSDNPGGGASPAGANRIDYTGVEWM